MSRRGGWHKKNEMGEGYFFVQNRPGCGGYIALLNHVIDDPDLIS